ncbi:MAG: hypothetical protein U0V04_19540 [Spirosomataceae bacterium]|jgi:hypothetical protein
MAHKKHLKSLVYSILFLLLITSGLVVASRVTKKETPEKVISKPLTAAEMKAARKKWEATPDGILFKKWEASPAGKKVYASEAKIRKSLIDSTRMEGVITAVSLPIGSRLGHGVMVRIKEDDFILSFGPLKTNEFQQLHSLKVNDNILIGSRNVSHAPKYAYPILSGDYVERDGKIIYKRLPRKGGC